MTLAFKSDAATDITWQNIDPASLPPSIRKLYDAYKAQYAIANDARKAFEDAFRSAVVAPSGQQAVLGYRFGKLSFAFAPIKAPAARANLVSFAALTRK